MTKKNALVLIAPGSEEIEAVVVIDTLARADIKVTVAAVGGNENYVECSRGVKIVPDIKLNQVNVQDYDIMILPGGYGGTEAFKNSPKVLELIKTFYNDKSLAAICAAPTALLKAGVAKGRKITSYPSFKEEFDQAGGYHYIENERVVVDGNLITSKGPATSFDFALSLVDYLTGNKTMSQKLKGDMLLD
ncbi:hypothetical protein MP638_004377 [Amoeboaphelidium occidentale]|nr:hypothetical protein MP638_004377 [Amoeboaphelidium occidentale]